jgi:hypothetical protein
MRLIAALSPLANDRYPFETIKSTTGVRSPRPSQATLSGRSQLRPKRATLAESGTTVSGLFTPGSPPFVNSTPAASSVR